MEGRLPAAELSQAADSLVVALACAGDNQAFAEIVRRRQGRVRKFMYHLCRQTTLGDDLAQQVFLTAMTGIHRLRAAAAFDAWLKRIMVTTWLEEIRRQKLRYVSELDAEVMGGLPDSTSEQLDLDAALARLPPEVRVCVVLAYSEGMSHPEIVAATGLPLGTVKSHVSRGAARLRALLEAYSGAISDERTR